MAREVDFVLEKLGAGLRYIAEGGEAEGKSLVGRIERRACIGQVSFSGLEGFQLVGIRVVVIHHRLQRRLDLLIVHPVGVIERLARSGSGRCPLPKVEQRVAQCDVGPSCRREGKLLRRENHEGRSDSGELRAEVDRRVKIAEGLPVLRGRLASLGPGFLCGGVVLQCNVDHLGEVELVLAEGGGDERVAIARRDELVALEGRPGGVRGGGGEREGVGRVVHHAAGEQEKGSEGDEGCLSIWGHSSMAIEKKEFLCNSSWHCF